MLCLQLLQVGYNFVLFLLASCLLLCLQLLQVSYNFVLFLLELCPLSRCIRCILSLRLGL